MMMLPPLPPGKRHQLTTEREPERRDMFLPLYLVGVAFAFVLMMSWLVYSIHKIGEPPYLDEDEVAEYSAACEQLGGVPEKYVYIVNENIGRVKRIECNLENQ